MLRWHKCNGPQASWNQLLAFKVLASPMVAGGVEIDDPRWPSGTFCMSL